MKTLGSKNTIPHPANITGPDLKSDKLLLLRVSGDKNTLGKILDVNFETCLQLSYEKTDLEGSRLSSLLPGMVARFHDEWILKSYDNQRFTRLNAVSYGYIKDRHGFFHAVTLVVKVVPSLKQGLTFLAIIQLTSKIVECRAAHEGVHDSAGSQCLFICEASGKIIGINKPASHEFNLSPICKYCNEV